MLVRTKLQTLTDLTVAVPSTAQDRKNLNKAKNFVGTAQQYAFVFQSEGEHRQLHPCCCLQAKPWSDMQ